MEEISQIIGRRVRQLRKARNMTQEDYAEFIGITTKTLWKIESSKNAVRFETLDKILQKEQIPVYYLFIDDEKEQEYNHKHLNNAVIDMLKKLNNKEIETVNSLLELIVSKNK